MTASGQFHGQKALIRNALLKIEELQDQLNAHELRKREPIAIVGMGCRFPGGANNPEDFWKLLEKGEDARSETPRERWNVNDYYDENPDAPGKISTRFGCFLDSIAEFDPQLFGISPREALSMDPQQRILLEVAWETLENAHIPADRLYGSSTGVFLGIINQDYAQRLLTPPHLDQIDAYAGTGVSLGVAAGRLSYCFGLTGPSLSVDTACSSSLVALHLACDSLRRGECGLAFAGGVSLMLEPGLSVNFSRARMLAPDGRCKTFDAAADGYVRGEGCGLIILKRLSDARRDGDHILAVVAGSAINQDGASGGLTVPSGPSQEQVIRQALANANIPAGSISYIEAHGTGTALGDPIELGALDRVFGEAHTAANPLRLGSVKTNIGHLEAAAGIAGVIKLVLALQHERLPAHLHCDLPTPRFPWADKPFEIVRENQPWLRGPTPRAAGVSSFGFGGTNAHVIVGEAPAASDADAATELARNADAPPCPFLISAQSREALMALAARYRDHLRANPAIAPASLCAAAAAGRAHLQHRLSLVGGTVGEIADQLDSVVRGEASPALVSTGAHGGTPPSVAFLFTGEGAQYPGMGRRLYGTEPCFRSALDRCSEMLRDMCSLSLTELLFSETATGSKHLDLTLYAQPALFCLEYALSELWKSKGIAPDAVAGYGAGEYAAACIAGVFSLEDGLKLVAERARLMHVLPAGGAMAAIFAPEAAVARALAGRSGELAIAALNSPSHLVVSGTAYAMEGLLAQLQEEGIAHRRLNAACAFHSPLMEPMLAEFSAIAKNVEFHPPALPMVSTVTGALINDEIAQPGYWVRQLREPVRFAEAIETLRHQECRAFLEIGPDPILLGHVRKSSASNETLIASLRRGDGRQFMRSLGALHVLGAPVGWDKLCGAHQRRFLPLPTYPFQRERYWIERQPARNGESARGAPVHPFLGRSLGLPALPGEERFEQEISCGNFLRDHRVFGQAIFPAAAFLETALAAASRAGPGSGGSAAAVPTLALSDVSFERALIFREDRSRKIQTILKRDSIVSAVSGQFEIYSSIMHKTGESEWVRHCTGQILCEPAPEPAALKIGPDRRFCEIPIGEFYAQSRAQGLDYGPQFQALKSIWRADGESLGYVQLPKALADEAGKYHIHPALLDACFQTVLAALPEAKRKATWLPAGLKRFRLFRAPGTELWCKVKIKTIDDARGPDFQAGLSLFDVNGAAIGSIEQMRAARADTGALTQNKGNSDLSEIDSWFYGVDWQMQGLFGPRAHASLLASPPELAAELGKIMADLTHQRRLGNYGEALRELDRLSLAYMTAALDKMGSALRLGNRFSPSALAVEYGIAGAQRPLFDRILSILAEEGMLQPDPQGWRAVDTVDALNPERAREDFCKHYPGASVEFDLVKRCGSALLHVLQGRCDPIAELLFPGGDGSKLAALYNHTPAAKAMNEVLRRGLLSAIKSLPARCGVRILEIGGGTGGSSAAVLPALTPAQTEYVFTDLSTTLIRQAEARFADYPFVKFQTLDIENDPEGQGLTTAGFDIVIASNVLHATENVTRALTHTRRLLAPGGLLLLLEGSAPQHWVDLVFGMTSGWWRFRDTSLRPAHPLLPPDLWRAELERCGFEQAEAIECAPARQALIIARAGRATLESGPPAHWLIFADSSGTAEKLGALAQTAGSACTFVLPGLRYQWTHPNRLTIDPGQAEHYRRLLAEARIAGMSYCTHFWSLDTQQAAGMEASVVSGAERSWKSVLLLAQALGQAGLAPRLVLVTRGATPAGGEPLTGIAAAPLWGLGKTIALEYPEWRCLRIDLPPAPAPDEAVAIMAELSPDITGEMEGEIAFRSGGRFVPRLTRLSPGTGAAPAIPGGRMESWAVAAPSPGGIDALAWRAVARRAPGPGEVEIEVRSAGVNFKDVLLALRMIPEAGPVLGGECAGEIVGVGSGVTGLAAGDRVMSMAPGSFARYAVVPACTAAKLPAGLDFNAAATLPVAFLTAFHALRDLAGLKRGERVLIHAAAGGVGQAAIQLALSLGAEVFATASESKQHLVRSLGVAHVMNSRSLDFAEELRSLTGGAGVDVVLNSLGASFAAASLSLLPPGGRFIEIGIREVRTAEEVAALAPGVRYEAFDLLEIWRDRPDEIGRLMRAITAGLAAGELRPLPYRSFAPQEIGAALRLMQQAKHTGKIILNFDDHEARRLRKDGTYLITGGTGGLGLLTARWMAERDAGHIVLASRRAATPEVEAEAQALRQLGTGVTILRTDIANGAEVEKLFAHMAQSLPPLRGVIHAAGVLDDGVLSEQNSERFTKVLAPKIDGAWALHNCTRSLPLDFFILYSSASSLLGSAGQGNHVSANAFLDALAHARRACGLPGLSINWGAWSETGYAARAGADGFLERRGLGLIAPAAGVAVLDRIFSTSRAQIGAVPVDWPEYLRRTPASPYLQAVLPTNCAGQDETQTAFHLRLAAAPAEAKRALLMAHVMEQVAAVLRFPAPADPGRGFFEMGMDSLTSVELRNMLQISLRRALPATLAFDFPHTAALVDYLAGGPTGSIPGQIEPLPAGAEQNALDQLSEAEANAILLEELEAFEGRKMAS